jgi:hypothetical protein
MANQDPPHSDEDQACLVDESLIDALLALRPEERIRQNDRMLRMILQLRQGLANKGADNGQQG